MMAAVLGQWMHGYGWNGLWMGISMLVVWAVVIAVPVALVHGAGRRDDSGRRARDVLAERYARGEIDTDEFQTRTRELEKAET